MVWITATLYGISSWFPHSQNFSEGMEWFLHLSYLYNWVSSWFQHSQKMSENRDDGDVLLLYLSHTVSSWLQHYRNMSEGISHGVKSCLQHSQILSEGMGGGLNCFICTVERIFACNIPRICLKVWMVGFTVALSVFLISSFPNFIQWYG